MAEWVKNTRNFFKIRYPSLDERARVQSWTEKSPFRAGFIHGYDKATDIPLKLLDGHDPENYEYPPSKVPIIRELELISGHSGRYARESGNISYARKHLAGSILGGGFLIWALGVFIMYDVLSAK